MRIHEFEEARLEHRSYGFKRYDIPHVEDQAYTWEFLLQFLSTIFSYSFNFDNSY